MGVNNDSPKYITFVIEINMNKLQLSLLVAGASLGLGIYFSNNHPSKDVTLAVGLTSGGLLLGVGSTLYGNQIINGRKFKQLNSSNSELAIKNAELDEQAKVDAGLLTGFESEVKELNNKLSEATAQLNLIKNQKLATDNQNVEHIQAITKLQQTNRYLTSELEKLQETIKDKQARIEELDAENEASWAKELKDEAEKIFRQRAREQIIKEVEHDKNIALQAMAICEEYMRLAEEMFDDNEQHHTEAMTVNNKAKEVITNMKQAELQALGDKEDYIRDLQLKIDRLNAQLNGEIIEPEKRKGMVGRYWDIANFLIDHMAELGTNLRITGLEECGEYAVIAFGYSKSAIPTEICEAINKHGVIWAKSHGIHSIGNARLSQRFPAIEVTAYKDKPNSESDNSIYASGLIPADKIGDTLYRAITYGQKGKPTLRVMAGTRGGKGITLKNLVSYWLGLEENWEIWLSDPVSGSNEDYWDCSKIAINRTEAQEAYNQFYKVYKGRCAKKLPTSPKILGIFDEFDSEHTEEQHECAKEIMGRCRHVGMFQILVGQSAEVAKLGWNWDEMKNCALLVIEGSIGTLLKHNKDLMQWSTSKKNKVTKQYEKYRKWADEWNAANPDTPVENLKRIALLVIDDAYQFLEIPMAHKGILRDGSNVTMRNGLTVTTEVLNTTNAENADLKPTKSIQNTVLQSNDPLTMVACPHCGSVNISKQGKNNKGQQRYSCKDCKHSPRKWTY